ncbi:hypothetical protein PBCV1_a632L [Paramecium bursaria Chlorella virus 1]|uniref:Uncharacterized protein n=1 Tax=Paramecium bursaria Chlorella virus 1 TaxID=10506 RepID=O41114_PBCV1|nr:hypothetical protein PBCV1_a632L [Paramecium bursaria Chlorella virus 1]AAC97031.1 hypothetical protein [Paramecium bursaria Chlorella virus 1]
MTQTAVSSFDVYSRISIHKLLPRMVPALDCIFFLFTVSLLATYGCPVSMMVVTIVFHTSRAFTTFLAFPSAS